MDATLCICLSLNFNNRLACTQIIMSFINYGDVNYYDLIYIVVLNMHTMIVTTKFSIFVLLSYKYIRKLHAGKKALILWP